jgi:hypothetical protein
VLLLRLSLERLRDWLLPKSVWGSRLSNTVNRRCSSHELLLRLFGFYGAGRRLVGSIANMKSTNKIKLPKRGTLKVFMWCKRKNIARFIVKID